MKIISTLHLIFEFPLIQMLLFRIHLSANFASHHMDDKILYLQLGPHCNRFRPCEGRGKCIDDCTSVGYKCLPPCKPPYVGQYCDKIKGLHLLLDPTYLPQIQSLLQNALRQLYSSYKITVYSETCLKQRCSTADPLLKRS